MNPHWLPDIVVWNQTDGETWDMYEERLFRVFQQEFSPGQFLFRGEPVRFRRIPYTGHYPEAFVHLTTCKQDDGDERLPDLARSERIRWPRPVIERHPSCDVCGYSVCTKPWVWRIGKKVKIYLPNQQYLVVLEKRSDYWILITAYHLERRHSIEKTKREYVSRFSTVIQ